MSENQIIYQTEDELGPIMVLDDGECRTLAFAEGDNQSRCLKSAPHVLQYEYTQAMLLVLLFCRPKRVITLGLGGGSLLTTLHHHIPGIHIAGVELRPSVIDIAYKYFQMPRGKRLTIIQQSADDFLNEYTGRKADVLFADLYHAKGVDQTQLQVNFIHRCANRLKSEGWLVLNCWMEHREEADFLAALRARFLDVRVVMTEGQNWVILAGVAGDSQSTNALKDKALKLSGELGFPLVRHVARMQWLDD